MFKELFKLLGIVEVDGTEEAKDELDDVKDKAKESGNSMVDSFKKIGSAVVAYFAVDKIIDFGKTITDAAATVAAETSAFEQIMGDYTDQATKKMGEIADATDMVDTRLTPYMTSMTAKFKGLGFDIDEATTLASEGLTIAADAAAFWDKSLEDSQGSLNSFINGSYEGGEAIGLFANDTQMAAYAVKEGVVDATKEWANLDEATKQATRLQYAKDMMALSGATGQAAKEADQYANVQANLAEKWRQFNAQIGQPLLENVVLPAMEILSDLVDKLSKGFEDLSKWIAENGETIKLWGGIITMAAAGVTAFTVAMKWSAIMGAATNAIKAVTGAVSLFNAALLANPIGIIIGLIAALVAGFIYFWNTSEEFRAFWINLWDNIKKIFGDVVKWIEEKLNELGEWFADVWESISEVVSSAMEGIKSVIENVWNVIKTIITGVITVIAVAIGTGIEFWKSIITGTMNLIKSIIDAVWGAIGGTVTKVMNSIKSVITTVWNAIYSFVSTIVNSIKTVITNAFNAIKNVVTTIWNGIKSVTTSVWSAISNAISSAINGAKSVVSSVANGISSTVSSIWNGIKNTTSSVWNGIKSAIETPMNKAKQFVSGIVESIKGFFGFKITWPKIPLPHFGIKPKGWSIGDLLKGSIPSLAIDWYAKGGILEEPTAFGINPNGRLMVGGEAGPEAVAPIDELMGYVRTAVSEQTGSMNDTLLRILRLLAELLPNMKMQMVLDTGTLVGEITPQVDDELGRIKERKTRK